MLGTPIERTPPNGRIVVLRWDSMAAPKRWRYSPEYTAAHGRGLNYAKFNTIAVPGIAR